GEGQPVLVELGGLADGDHRLPPEGVPPVAEAQPPVFDLGVVRPLLRQHLLDLEQVREIAGGFRAHPPVHPFLAMVDDPQPLVEASADRAPTDHRQLRVDVLRGGAGHEEEPRLVVLQVVYGQRLEPLAVDGQDPGRQEPCVEGEQPGRGGRRGLDVAAVVADHERVTGEDVDHPVAHDCRVLSARTVRGSYACGGPGKSRSMAEIRWMFPSMSSSPRKYAALAFSSPLPMRSNTALSARTTHCASRCSRSSRVTVTW